MHVCIIIAKDKKKALDYAKEVCVEKHVNQFDMMTVELETELTKTKEKAKQSIGIAQIKELQKNLYQKPHSSPYKAIIIMSAETLTVEAQNALLKTLEEPPEHALIFLLASTKEGFLPTILSRCKVITLHEEQETISEKEKEEYQQVLKDLLTYGVGKRLKIAQDATKTKESALLWLEQMILALRQNLLQSMPQPLGSEAKLLRQLQQTYTTIATTNVAPRLAVEDLLLQL